MTDEPKAATSNQKQRKKIHRRIMDATGTDWCGNSSPPLTNRKVYVHDDGSYRVFSMVDDGGFVGIGYPDEWQVIMRTRAARMFAWWTFKVWLADWCGLRSHIYYVGLHRSVRGAWRLDPYRDARRRTRADTRISSHEEWHAERT